ncbi:DUF3558 domain-containing protein [Sciscionella sediminilitoris]|uniref:DUF3558 domain-containing protein n=1 Tax=Sciscionella sediminilitoris TaxID=1445613 RepID=UPI0004DF79B4|nr:DUF3558 domain-containing protein [Sciscionella sp. SE31]
MHSRTLSACVLACAAVLATACSGTPHSTPAEQSPAPSSPALSSAPSSAPQSKAGNGIDLAGADPCGLLSAAKASAIGMPAKGSPARNEVLDNAPMCGYTSEQSHLGLLLTAVSSKGLEFFGPGKVAGSVRKTTVAGLPAFQNRPTDAPPGSDFCTVTVGVRSGQALDVLYREDAAEESRGEDFLCQRAKQAANAAVGTLRAK